MWCKHKTSYNYLRQVEGFDQVGCRAAADMKWMSLLCFSPFIAGESVISTVGGSTYLWSVNG